MMCNQHPLLIEQAWPRIITRYIHCDAQCYAEVVAKANISAGHFKLQGFRA